NKSSKFQCTYGNDFKVIAGSRNYHAESSLFKAAKNTIGLDYPGFFLGQCMDAGETVDSFLVFDIPNDQSPIIIDWNGIQLNIGDVNSLRNPLPTATPPPTPTKTATASPTPTLTST